jgi:branched-subunit amino acid aminotransferase/4-amino-4-deoxychorismate lyase
MVMDGGLVTPASGMLDGMTRRTVIEIAQERAQGWLGEPANHDLRS